MPPLSPSTTSIRPYGGQARLYDREYRLYTDDLPFYLERLQHARVRGRVLELGSGTGRVTFPLAEAGYEVLGLELNPDMLRQARRRRLSLRPEVAGRVSFTQQDMGQFRVRGSVDAVLIPFSTLALLPTPELRRSCLLTCSSVLQPGGHLWIDLFHLPEQAEPLKPYQTRLEEQFLLPPHGHRVLKVTEERVIPERRVREVLYHYTVRPYDADRVIDAYTVAFELACLDREEVEGVLGEAGFDVLETFGDYRGGAYGPRSDRYLVECRRHA